MKTQPITQKAKGSPFKMNETLVQGAADLGASTYTKKSKKVNLRLVTTSSQLNLFL